jgi:hypothetical protein
MQESPRVEHVAVLQQEPLHCQRKVPRCPCQHHPAWWCQEAYIVAEALRTLAVDVDRHRLDIGPVSILGSNCVLHQDTYIGPAEQTQVCHHPWSLSKHVPCGVMR